MMMKGFALKTTENHASEEKTTTATTTFFFKGQHGNIFSPPETGGHLANAVFIVDV